MQKPACSQIQHLFATISQVGRLEWIGLRPAHHASIQTVTQVEVDPNKGLAGDHYSGGQSKRQITLIQQERLPVIAALCQAMEVRPEQLRRNLVVSGINLRALYNERFYVGEVLLEGTGFCQPCSRMEEALGPGGYNAVRGHGGITAEVLSSGVVHVGDEVRHCPVPANEKKD